ncbi:hypothetical protein DMH17_15770 [Raoultella planticola]|nr:hypothetical protein [Raoultella planticola]
MILKTRIPAFPALIIAAVITGSLGGMKSEMMIASVTRGFGGTLGISVSYDWLWRDDGIAVADERASKRMAISFINLLGKGREAGAGDDQSNRLNGPVFCDSAFIVLVPLVGDLPFNREISGRVRQRLRPD